MSASAKTLRVDVSRYPVHALIREADGLLPDDKLLLHTIASHKGGKSFASVTTLRQWTGLSRNRYYRARSNLLGRRVISEKPSRGGVTTYRLQRSALEALAHDGILRRQGVPATGSTPSHVGHGTTHRAGQATHPRFGDTKMNTKPNTEEIKNIKSARRVRRPARPTSVAVSSSEAAGAERLSEQIQSLRDRLAERQLHWGSTSSMTSRQSHEVATFHGEREATLLDLRGVEGWKGS